MSDADEKVRLLGEARSPDSQGHLRRMVPKRLVVVEPVIILYACAGLPTMTVFNQYLLRKVGYDMDVDYDHLNSSMNATCGTSLNDTVFLQREAVQAQAAHWKLYISLVKFLPSIIGKVVYGALSDRRGRHFCFILPPIGSITSAVLYLCIIHFNLPIEMFFLDAIEYCFGSMHLLVIGSFAYIADTTDRKWLAFRITIIDVTVFLSAGLGELGVGYLIKYSGYFWPLVFVLAFKVLTLIYAIFFIPETVSKVAPNAKNISDTDPSEKARRPMALKDYFSALKLLTRDNGTGRLWKLWLLSASYFLYEFYSLQRITQLYQQNVPLCWGSVMLGYYTAVVGLSTSVGSMVGAGFKRWVPEHWLMVLGKTSSVLALITFLMATSSVIMFMVPLVGFFGMLSIPMIRAILSTYVQLDEQASLFAAMFCISTVCQLLGSLAVNNVYAATLLWYPGTTFVVAICVQVISLGLVLLFIYKTKGDRRDPQQLLINEE